MAQKLIVVIIGESCQKTIAMCLESVKDADKIIYVDGGSTDDTINIFTKFDKENNNIEWLSNNFDKSNPNMISIQRNFYLDYLKKNHMDDFCLVLDADEVLDDGGIKELKSIINEDLDREVFSIKMRHLMYTLALEDATQQEHMVPNRFFKITNELFYPEGEHTILSGARKHGEIIGTQIWHLAYLGGIWDVKKRYDQQKLRGNGHNPEYLEQWNKTHILGRYPIRQICTDDLPDTILRNFGLSAESVYFQNRMNVEHKHFIFIKQWNKFFKPKSVADFGCGTGLYLYAWEITGVHCEGFEYSKYAREHKKCDSEINKIDLNKENEFYSVFNLVTALDVLEHLEYKTLDNALNTLISASNKYILTSIPYKGTPNCELDKTHLIKESEDWWRQKFLDKGLNEVEVPQDWIYREQLLIFEK
jgi:glycosyltransferase involved in cell wall biosynthesis